MMKLNKKGFTLVELLAVIVVLALLMVVAGRAIGTSLDNSKKNAMKTEAQKIVSKTYEDLQTAKALGDPITYTYAGVKDGSFTEGDYTIKITINESDYTMSSVCIKYGDTNSKYGSATIDGSEIDFGTDDANLYTSTNCMGS